MTDMSRSLHELPRETIRLLGSSQVITSVFSVVKELIENSLDAGATSLELRLENYGLDKIELRDNGSGIPTADVPLVAKKYHTSKITSFSDLEDLVTYGFRGEALGSLCSISNLSITTRTKDEEISTTYCYNYQGQITSSRPTHLGKGTTITALNLFKNLPVRRQFYNTNKKKKDELKRIEDLLLSYGIIFPSVRISLRHNKDVVWQKNPVSDLKTAIFETLGNVIGSNLQKRELVLEFPKVEIEMYLPSVGCEWTSVSRSVNDRSFVFINHRPVHHKEIEKMIRNYLGLEKGRYPVFIISIVIPPSDLDVNVEPNKTRVFLHKQEAILELLEDYLKNTYDPMKHCNKENNVTLNVNLQMENGEDEAPAVTITKSQGSYKEVRSTPMETTNHQVKVITMDDMSLLDESLPVIKVTLAEGEKNNEGHLEKVANVAPESEPGQSSRSENPNMFSTQGLNIRSSAQQPHPVGENGTIETLSDRYDEKTALVTDGLDMPVISFDVVTPDDPKERSNVISQNNEFTDDSLSELLSSWPETCNSGKEQTESAPDVAVMENYSKEPTAPSGEQWSKGQGLKGSSGEVIEPVKILNCGKRPLSPDSGHSPPMKRRSLEVNADDSGTFSTPQKENAFKLFAKKMTSKVITANPNCSGSRISELIREAWDNLSVSERTTYELRAGAQTAEKGGTKPLLNQSLKNKVQNSKLHRTPSIKEQLLRTARKHGTSPESFIPRKEKAIPFSLRKLRETFSSCPPASQMTETQCWELIGPLKSCGIWTCYHDYKIHILNPHRVHETVLYHRLMRDHVLPTEPLERPIKITPDMLGSHWETFRELALQYRTSEMYPILRDSRFTSNGIHIKLFFDSSGDVQAELSSLSSCIPTYGVEDLKEILELIHTTGADSIPRSRPLKVINYLKSEAVRMARQLPRQQDYDDMQDLLCQVRDLLPKGCYSCLHDRPFLYAVYDMSSLPLTQYSQSQRDNI
ncbi:PMS1 protein homolog 1-like [Saccostrea echinata]|uniref:PMS1 protein homolog 1-like n=1 Tax=Saccostrea echinata TaxID=191078 RepID=UPI002A80FB76|nr:PMS1 protein homolog 1-like [Saccostrea echinata]